EETVRYISAQKEEPQWLLNWRLKAFRRWQEMVEPHWAQLDYAPIDYQNAYYYASPQKKKTVQSLDEVDPKILETYKKLGIPLEEQKRLAGVESKVAVDAVFDSVSIGTTYQGELLKHGIIFCSFSEAVREH